MLMMVSHWKGQSLYQLRFYYKHVLSSGIKRKDRLYKQKALTICDYVITMRLTQGRLQEKQRTDLVTVIKRCWD
jgi:hypothetical protein